MLNGEQFLCFYGGAIGNKYQTRIHYNMDQDEKSHTLGKKIVSKGIATWFLKVSGCFTRVGVITEEKAKEKEKYYFTCRTGEEETAKSINMELTLNLYTSKLTVKATNEEKEKIIDLPENKKWRLYCWVFDHGDIVALKGFWLEKGNKEEKRLEKAEQGEEEKEIIAEDAVYPGDPEDQSDYDLNEDLRSWTEPFHRYSYRINEMPEMDF